MCTKFRLNPFSGFSVKEVKTLLHKNLRVYNISQILKDGFQNINVKFARDSTLQSWQILF